VTSLVKRASIDALVKRGRLQVLEKPIAKENILNCSDSEILENSVLICQQM
jgi:hypothetical protein